MENTELKDLMTAQEARDAFKNAGLSPATFHRRVNEGMIESFLPQGRQRGAYYPRNQVLAAIGQRSAKKATKPSASRLKHTTSTYATVEDMSEIALLLETLYGVKTSAKKRRTWVEKNPEIVHILVSEEHIVGCAFLLPMAEATILNSLNSEVKPTVNPDEILRYTPSTQCCLYLRSAGIMHAVSREQFHCWTAMLILRIIRSVIDLGKKGVTVDKIYAQGDAKHYQRALKLLGFVQIASQSTLHKNFMLDLSVSHEHSVVLYKQALNTWRSQNQEE
jgi:hypothetical protein